MLNVPLIKKAMRNRGLSGKDIGDACHVTKEAASNWLNGESLPRPGKLVDLAEALDLSIEDLVLSEEMPAEPVVAFRMRKNKPPTPAAQEAGNEVARHLRQLVPLMGGHTLFSPRRLAAPVLTEEYIVDAANAARYLLGLGAEEKVTHQHLFELFKRSGVVLVPVMWGGDREGHENAMSVYLPDTGASFVLFNLGCRVDDFSYWLAHEFGHSLSLHILQGDDGENFAEKFAQHLLFPDAVARKALADIQGADDKWAKATWYAGAYDVSIVAVVKAADKVAAIDNVEPTGLATAAFYARWNATRHEHSTVANMYFGSDIPSSMEYFLKSEELFATPIFRALASFQRLEGKSPAFVSATLNVGLLEGVELAQALTQLGA